MAQRHAIAHYRRVLARSVSARAQESRRWLASRLLIGTALAILFALIALGIRFVISGPEPAVAPFSIFFGFLVALTVFAGSRVAFVFVVVSGTLSWFFLLEPAGSWSLPADQLAALVIYFIIAGVLVALAELPMEAHRRWQIERQRIRERQKKLVRMQAFLSNQLTELQVLYESAPLGLGMLDCDLRFVRVNSALAEINGFSIQEHVGRSVWELAPTFQDRLEPVLLEVIRQGQPVNSFNLKGTTPARPGLQRSWIAHFYPLRGARGAVEGIGLICEEVTERRLGEERERLLTLEVDHRAKNLLGVVQSVVRLTRAVTVDEFKYAVQGRIQALARTHTLIAERRWDGAFLEQIIEDELAPYKAAGTAKIRGPSLLLRPAAAQSIALVIHELATNAAKYGAWSRNGGQVKVEWAFQTEPKEGLHLTWRESGGPLVGEPHDKGFGSNLIQLSIERQLGGELTMNYAPEGLQCEIQIPATQFDADVLPFEPPPRAPDVELKDASLNGRSVLIVEDEILQALEIKQFLEGLGCTVVGPASSLERAMELAQTSRLDAAILDYSLDGQSSESVALELQDRDVPFVICTGHAQVEALPDAMKGVPIIRKPFDEKELLSKLTSAFSASLSA